jgi:hypothetical protein
MLNILVNVTLDMNTSWSSIMDILLHYGALLCVAGAAHSQQHCC